MSLRSNDGMVKITPAALIIRADGREEIELLVRPLAHYLVSN